MEMRSDNEAKKRIYEYDAIRFVATLLVVLGHSAFVFTIVIAIMLQKVIWKLKKIYRNRRIVSL